MSNSVQCWSDEPLLYACEDASQVADPCHIVRNLWFSGRMIEYGYLAVWTCDPSSLFGKHSQPQQQDYRLMGPSFTFMYVVIHRKLAWQNVFCGDCIGNTRFRTSIFSYIWLDDAYATWRARLLLNTRRVDVYSRKISRDPGVLVHINIERAMKCARNPSYWWNCFGKNLKAHSDTTALMFDAQWALSL